MQVALFICTEVCSNILFSMPRDVAFRLSCGHTPPPCSFAQARVENSTDHFRFANIRGWNVGTLRTFEPGGVSLFNWALMVPSFPPSSSSSSSMETKLSPLVFSFLANSEWAQSQTLSRCLLKNLVLINMPRNKWTIETFVCMYAGRCRRRGKPCVISTFQPRFTTNESTHFCSLEEIGGRVHGMG